MTAHGRDWLVVGGRRAVLEAVRARTVRRILVSRSARATPALRDLLDEAARAGVPVEEVANRELDEAGPPDHHGVAATISRPRDLDERALMALPFAEDALVVVLDGIEDPQNLGSAARSAEAGGAAALVIRRRRSADVTASAIRASSGALMHLPVARVTNLTRTLEALKDVGFAVAGLDHRAEETIYTADPPAGRLAVVVGGEGTGISRLVRQACDVLVRIPMGGRVGSLNASAALAAGLFGFALRPPRAGGGRTMLSDAGVAQSGSASDL